MTAPRVPLGVLDDLEAALEASKPGPWRVSASGEDVVSPTHGVVADAYEPADAAAIVAAVNLAPKLLAAVRAMETLAKAWEREANERDGYADRLPNASAWHIEINRLVVAAEHQRRCAKNLIRALSSALGAEGADRG